MSTPAEPIATLHHGKFRAEIFSTDLPGEFIVRFLNGEGHELESITLTGVSTYRQRETEITDRLRAFADGEEPGDPADLAAAGEY